jgi:hypothetical protein
MRKLLPVLIAALALSAAELAFANCEAGGYWIHTVAEYKTYEPHRVILPYWKEGPESLGLDANGLDRLDDFAGSLRKPNLSLRHDERSCSGAAFTVRKRYVQPHEYRLDAPDCRELFEKLSGRGYLLLDQAEPAVRFSETLPIGVTDLEPDDRIALEAQIRGQVMELTLYAEAGPTGRFQDERIWPGDIVSTRVEVTTVGAGPRPFVMAVAVLTLHNLDRLYPSIEWDPGLGAKLRGHTIEYPVIFFRPPNAELRFVGDGSSCAVYPVASAASLPNPPIQLGAIERFRLTGAFDTNSDGAPDLIEVNDRFTYLLEPDGTMLVVKVGLGC